MTSPTTPTTSSPADAQALLAAIIASSDDAIISKDLNGIIQSWNQSAERIFGYTAEEIVGKPITTLFPPDRLDEEPQILARLKRGERVDHFETIRIRKDGTPIAISVTISPIRDRHGNIVGASKVARDITQNVELEGKFKAIITSSDDAIISKDLNGIVQSWNESAQRMFGYTAEEMVGKSITTLFPPDRLDEEPKILEQFAGASVWTTLKQSVSARMDDNWTFRSPYLPSKGQLDASSAYQRSPATLPASNAFSANAKNYSSVKLPPARKPNASVT